LKDTPIDPKPITTVLGIHHATLIVSDLARAGQFYAPTGLIPCELEVWQQSLPNSPAPALLLKAPNGCLELRACSNNTEAKPLPVIGPGITHACFQAPAQSSLYRQLIAGGADPVSVGEPPIDLNGAGVRYAYARDPDGAMFEVEELDEPRFTGPIWLAHIALATPDIDRAVLFYSQLLGVQPYSRVNKIVGPRFDEVTGLSSVRIRAAWFNVGNMVLEFWEFVQPRTPSHAVNRSQNQVGYDEFAIEVADLSWELNRLEGLGLSSETATVAGAGISEARFRDPDGNEFTLVQTTEDAETRVALFQPMHWLPAPAWPVVSSR